MQRTTIKEWTLKRCDPSRWESSCEKMCRGGSWRPVQKNPALITAMRQVGVGSQGGAEALAVVQPMPKDRGAEQEVVDGPSSATRPLGVVASEARLHVAEQHAEGTLPWVCPRGADAERLHGEHQSTMHLFQNLQHRGPEKLIGADPRHALQENGVPVPPITGASLSASLRHSQRNKMAQKETNKRQKSSTTSQIWTTLFLTRKSVKSALWPPSTQRYTATSHSESQWDHGAASKTNSWQKSMSSEPCTIVFSYFGTRKQNLPSFAKVLMSRINHTFRVHGHTVPTEEAAAKTFDEVG